MNLCRIEWDITHSEACWHLAVVRLWVVSVFPGLFLQPSDFAHDVFAHHVASLTRLCWGRFWRQSWRLHSWGYGVLSFIPFIVIRFCNKIKKNCKKEIELAKSSICKSRSTSEMTLLRNSLCERGGPSWTLLKSREGVAHSTLVVGRGDNSHYQSIATNYQLQTESNATLFVYFFFIIAL